MRGFAVSVDSPVAQINFVSATPRVPDRHPDESYPDLRVWRAGEVLHLEHVSGVSARSDRNEIEVGGEGHLGRAFRRIFLPAIAHMLGHRDRWVLHGGLISTGGRGVLILGATGRGKSTLVGAAWRAGWSAHGDDLTVLRSGSEGIEACALPRPPAIPVEAVPPGFVHVGTIDARRRVEIDPSALASGWVPLRAVILLEHGVDTEVRVTPVPLSQIIQALLGSFPSASNPALCRPYLRVAAAAASLPRWVFRHSPDARSRVEAACRMLDDVAGRLSDGPE